MGFLADLLIRIGGDATDLKKELGGARRDLQSWGRDLENVGRTMTAAITVPILGVGAAALKMSGELQQNSIAFTTMMKSSVEAGKHLADLKDFALRTPFQFNDLVLASKRMQALGFESKAVIPALRNIGDAAAALGMGAEGIQRIVTALGQMKAKGAVQAEEMRQLAEAGIPAWDILAKKLNTDVAGAMKLVEQRAVSAGTAVPAILAGINERFGGLMSEQSKTFLGQLSNLKDAMMFTLQDLGKSMLPIAQNVMSGVLQPMADGLKNMAAGFNAMPPGMQQTIIAFGGLLAAIGPAGWAIGAVSTGLANIVSLVLKLPALINPVTLAIVALGTAAGIAFYELDKGTERLHSLDKDFSEFVSKRVKDTKDFAGTRDELKRAMESGALGAADYARALEMLETREKAAVGEGMNSFLKGVGASIVVLKEGGDAAKKWTKEQVDAANRAVDAWEEMDKRYTQQAQHIIAESKRILEADEEYQRSFLYGRAVFAATHDAMARKAQETVDIVVPLYERMGAAMWAAMNGAASTNTVYGVGAASGAATRQIEIVGAGWSEVLKQTKKEMNEVEREARRAFDSMARSMARSIIEWKGFGEGVKNVAKDLGASFLEIMIRTLFKPLEAQFAKLAGWIGNALGIGGSAASGAAGAAASAGGAVASGVGGGASAAGGAVSAGMSSTVGMITGAVSAVSGVVGNFQMAGMNKSLDLIEHETRYTHLILQAMMDLQNLHLPKLESIWGYFWTVQTEYLNKITAALEPGGSASGKGGATTVNVYLDSKKIWSGLATQAQLQGA